MAQGALMEGHGLEKFRDATLLATSANRAWSLISAELRSHPAGESGAFAPQNALITQTVADTNAAYSVRGSGGVRQKLVAKPGTTWLFVRPAYARRPPGSPADMPGGAVNRRVPAAAHIPGRH